MNSQRMFRIVISAVAALLVAGALSFAPAAEPKGNEGKGRYLFRQTCKDCHVKGAKGKEVSPLTKTMAQWKTYFLKGTHNNGAEPLTKVMGEDQLRDVRTFVIAHAADSPQPETCGK